MLRYTNRYFLVKRQILTRLKEKYLYFGWPSTHFEMPFNDIMKPINSMCESQGFQYTWRPSYECLRRFDPLSKREVQIRMTTCQPLVQLCRRVILKSIHMSEIETAPTRLPLPRVIANTICKLKIDDFFINPLKVQTRDLLTGCYTALETFKMQEVVLEVLPGGAKGKDFRRRPEYMTSFNDRGVLCIVWDPVNTLEELLRTTTRIGHHLSHYFVWQVIEAVSIFMSAHCRAYDWYINPSMIKLAKNKGTIYIDNTAIGPKADHIPLSMNHAPEILTGGRYNPEKAFVWALGSLIYEMITLTPLVYDSSTWQQGNLAVSFKCPWKTNPGKMQPLTRAIPTREAYDRLINNLSLRNLTLDCLNNDPLLRPRIRNIIAIAKEEMIKSQPHKQE